MQNAKVIVSVGSTVTVLIWIAKQTIVSGFGGTEKIIKAAQYNASLVIWPQPDICHAYCSCNTVVWPPTCLAYNLTQIPSSLV